MIKTYKFEKEIDKEYMYAHSHLGYFYLDELNRKLKHRVSKIVDFNQLKEICLHGGNFSGNGFSSILKN